MLDSTKWHQILDLDLADVKRRLRGRKGWWWRRFHDADRLESEYRQFLFLVASNAEKTVVPWSEAMDDFWHEHILDTRKYEADCLAIFGRMMHHNPHLTKGSRPQREAFRATKVMYRTAFSDRPKPGNSADHVGCMAVFPVVFCAADTSSHGDGGHGDAGHAGGDHGDGGSSCGASCGASCGGGGCGGGGCGGG